MVNTDDFTQLLAALGCTEACALDFNNDGIVDVNDLNLFLQEFGSLCDQ
jgi:hypothetical protein